MEIKKIYETMEYGPAPESSAEVFKWLENHKQQFNLFIDGKWQVPSTKEYFDSENPADRTILARIAKAGPKDVDKAVNAASKALDGWKKIGGHNRAKYLYAIARQLQKNSRLFAVLETLDNGKPIRESRDIDIPLVARHFYHHAGWAQLMDSEMKDYEAVGVVGQIIPWNFPMLMLSWKVAPALATGNTVVLKPAALTSLTALFFAEICELAGLPPGVFNVITGPGGIIGEALVKHPDVAKIAFTGSTEIGRGIRKATAGSGKKISLELGGKSPFIVFEDADIDSAVEGLVDAIWFNQGQVCCAGSRLLVQESIADKFYQKVKARMAKLRVANPLDKSTDIGAIVSTAQIKTIDELVKLGIDEGGSCWQPDTKLPTEGLFYPPTLFTDMSPSATIVQEEIFGPVLVAMSFRTHTEAVKLANNTRYGLAASIWTENINLALDIAPKVKAGTVWINCTNVFDAASGFGGYRESGFGREGGLEGLYEYVKPKSEKLLSEKPVKKGKEQRAKSKVLEVGSVGIDRTAKLYIGGKQCRPDGGYSTTILSHDGEYLGEVPKGNRKDIRNAVEAAHAGTKWPSMTGHARAQVLYYLAENLSTRKVEFANRLMETIGATKKDADNEVDLSIERIYTYAALADKYDGHVHHTITKNVTLAMPEALGVMGIVCPDEAPLLGFISTVIPAITMGNNVVVVPSETSPLSATDLYQVFETSDIPAGTINIVTGQKEELTEVLAKHDDVDGIWYFGTKEGSATVEYFASENMKPSWVNYGKYRNWFDKTLSEGQLFLRKASQIKNIWIPYGA